MTGTGGKVEILLLKRLAGDTWETLVKPGKRLNIEAVIGIPAKDDFVKVTAEITGRGENGTRVLKFSDADLLPALGEIALPPYIHTPLEKAERYQTVYVRQDGSVAAPTADLHFTPDLLLKIKEKGIIMVPVVLHVGLGTFRPYLRNTRGNILFTVKTER